MPDSEVINEARQWELTTHHRLTEDRLESAIAEVLPRVSASATWTKRLLGAVARLGGVSNYDAATKEERCRARHKPGYDGHDRPGHVCY